jgi:glycerol kinase
LTQGQVHATDAATASRTALFDIRWVDWSPDLLAAFGLSRDALPEIRWTCGDFGVIDHAEIPRRGVPITADAVDAHAALFAQNCFDMTVAKATYGTGAFIEVNTGKVPVEPDGILPVFIAWQIAESVDYSLEGGVFSVGSAIDWAVRTGLVPSAAATSDLAESVADTAGVFFVPSFTGLAAPHWATNARAAMLGMGLDTTQAHIARALLDGIAFSCAEVLDALNQRLGGTLQTVRVDGGPTRNAYLMQRQADVLGMPVAVSEEADMTAMGAALLAGLGAGALALTDIEARERKARVYEPRIGADERAAQWQAWRRRVQVVRELAA